MTKTQAKPKGWTGNKEAHAKAAKKGWEKRFASMQPATDAEINEINKKRDPRTRAMDEAFTSKRVFKKGDPRTRAWLKHPGHYDIEGIDTRLLSRAGIELRGDETEAELKALIKKAATRLKDLRPKRARTVTRVKLETDRAFDPRKHGHAYVAFLQHVPSKGITREFVNGEYKKWDSKHKYYSQVFQFEAPEGAVIEARLSDGSWKNESRDYFVIEQGQIQHVSQSDAQSRVEN